MDESNEKIYMWLAILTFVAFCIAITFGVLHINEYKDPNHVITENIF